MALRLTMLPDDGADFQCGFRSFVAGGDWRCPKKADGAISLAAADATRAVKQVFLHGTAVCANHARVLEEDFGIKEV